VCALIDEVIDDSKVPHQSTTQASINAPMVDVGRGRSGCRFSLISGGSDRSDHGPERCKCDRSISAQQAVNLCH